MDGEQVYELYRADWRWQTPWQDLPAEEQSLWNDLAEEIRTRNASAYPTVALALWQRRLRS